MLVQDGKCYQLGSQGPCEEFQVLSLSPDHLEPQCLEKTSKIKRVYDIIPTNRGLVLDGPLSRRLKVTKCFGTKTYWEVLQFF